MLKTMAVFTNKKKFLFEYEESRRCMFVDHVDDIPREVALLMKSLFGVEAVLNVLPSCPTSDDEEGGCSSHIIQRWSKQWNCFVDVLSVIELSDGDHIKVVLAPGTKTASEGAGSEFDSTESSARNILKKVSKPTKPEARVLSQMFPTSSASQSKSVKAAFNPLALSSDVAHQKSKKKKAIKGGIAKKPKLTAKTVFMLSKDESKVPRGEARKRLERQGRVKVININRLMDSDEIREAILDTFKWVHSYSVLCQEVETKSSKLEVDSVQNPDGKSLVERRGCLYLLVKEGDEFIALSDSSENEQPASMGVVGRTILQAKRMLHKLKSKPSLSVRESEASEEEAPPKKKRTVAVQSAKAQNGSGSSAWDATKDFSLKNKIGEESGGSDATHFRDDNDDLPDVSRSLYGSSKAGSVSESLQGKSDVKGETPAMIIEQQDREYLESLNADRRKDNRCRLLRQLKKKWTENHLHVPDSNAMKFSIRLPDSTKIDCSILSSSSTQILYEIAFSNLDPNSPDQPISLYCLWPRRKIPVNGLVSEANLESPAVLFTEYEQDAPDPLVYLQQAQEPESYHAHTSEESVDGITFVKNCKAKRELFTESILCKDGDPHVVRRSSLYEDILSLYRYHSASLLQEKNFSMEYEDEIAVDAGGVTRDVFSFFWEQAYLKKFDGGGVLVPVVTPHDDLVEYSVLGTVMSHSYLSCGFLPVRIAFPVICAVLKGIVVSIPDTIVLESFLDFLSMYEATVVRQALAEKVYNSEMVSSLISLLSRFGCREIPTPSKVKSQILQVAKHEMLNVTLRSVHLMHSGIPSQHQPFWNSFTVEDLFKLYRSVIATPSKVLSIIAEPCAMNAAEQRVFDFLRSFVGNLNSATELPNFLRFVTGSSVCVGRLIGIEFNKLEGIARRPIAHTCSCVLELSVAYATSVEFAQEFKNILSSEFSWIMDAL